MRTFLFRGIRFTAAAGAVLALGACVSTGTLGRSPVGGLPTGTTTAPSSSSSATAVPSSPATAIPSTSVAAVFSGSQLQAALLPASVFGSGAVFYGGYPKSADGAGGQVSDATAVACDLVLIDGPNSGSQSEGMAIVKNSAEAGMFGVENVFRYTPGDAENMMRILADRFIGGCASYSKKMDDGTTTKDIVTTSKKFGIGDEAFTVEDTARFATGGDYLTEGAFVRVGDAIVVVSFASSNVGEARTFDAIGDAKAIAAKLVSP